MPSEEIYIPSELIAMASESLIVDIARDLEIPDPVDTENVLAKLVENEEK